MIANNVQITTDSKYNIYRKRQAIVEHPHGTIKRQWGYSYILTKQGIEKAESDVGFMFIAYNLRRIINIIGKNNIMKYLQEVISRILTFLSRFYHDFKPK